MVVASVAAATVGLAEQDPVDLATSASAIIIYSTTPATKFDMVAAPPDEAIDCFDGR